MLSVSHACASVIFFSKCKVILIARTSILGKTFVAGLEIAPDAPRMLAEMGINPLLERDVVSINPRQIIEAVQKGNLRTHFATPQEYGQNMNRANILLGRFYGRS